MSSPLSTPYRILFDNVKKASRRIANLDPLLVGQVLEELAKSLVAESPRILAANRLDLDLMNSSDPKYDRLRLTKARIESMASDLLKIASLPSPLARQFSESVLDNGLRLSKITIPIGVIGFIYEARPNVTIDVFALCLKSGNGCILKGASDAAHSNQLLFFLILKALSQFDIDTGFVQLLPTERSATSELLNASQFVDVIIPRGGRELIDFVKVNSRVPVIETGAGVVHLYFDKDGDTQKGSDLILNSKTRKVSACNSLDSLLIHKSRLTDLPALVNELIPFNVLLYCAPEAAATLRLFYPEHLLLDLEETSNATEYLTYGMTINLVEDVEQAVEHINYFTARNSEAIVTENQTTARYFQTQVDAAVVYVNAATGFTDGAQFGLGAEVGISTQKLHASGPMGLQELTSYKWLVNGEGQIRT
ncbi:gamma-glutamyl phosphate reductase [Dyadobacter frigoris]|uniref:glutamate-5-semialdehyde dehydrogenase n=1 Tax=Dyadobacter frigoris TaxID=2576211 RepID=UPI0024A36B49|nr:glutamate-5-semialdehyde dehydrogenase [Dyadobacter frigoris]GLU54694.1 gamma-glutamyl phosphate reductase [Dyadobacter frigoris]